VTLALLAHDEEDTLERPPTTPFTSALDQAAAVRRREISPVELVEAHLARIAERDVELNAFCHRADDDVRARAVHAAEVVVTTDPTDLPPLHGVPIAVKDMFEVAGWPTRYGSRGSRAEASAVTHPVVQRLLDAGCLPIGKTTTSEVASISFTESEASGITRNPWDPARTPGGSSGGSAVAVAAGMAPLGFGGDGGGSLRVPASCTGTVGLKATRGRVAPGPVEMEGLVTSGVMARTVADVAASLDVIGAHDPGTWWSPPSPGTSFLDAARRPARPLRIGVLVRSPVPGIDVDPACVAAVATALDALEAAGHHVVDAPVDLPPPEELVATFTAIWNLSGVTVDLADLDAVEPHNRALREAAQALDSWTYARAVDRAQRMSRAIVASFVERFDLLVTPTMSCLPPPVGAWRAGVDDDPLAAVRNCHPMVVFTTLCNMTGMPAISVPVGRDGATGLPVGVQVAAAPWREDFVLQAATVVEEACAPTGDHRVPVEAVR
jgi:amidase